MGYYHIELYSMEETKELRRILALNIKRHRENLGISQEKLAELAEISANMMTDIECCRTWVSDKTLIKLANALKIDVFRLLLPVGLSKEEIISTIYVDIAQDILKAKKDVNTDFEKILKKWGLC